MPSAGRYVAQAIGGDAGRFTVRFKAIDENGATAIRKFSGSTWPGHTAVYIVQYSPTPDANFSVTQLAPFSHFCASMNVSAILPPSCRVKANFTLGPGSKGADPVTQPVSLQFSSYAATIPVGSFTRNKGGDYSFDGMIENVRLKARILPEGANKFAFDVEAQGVGLYLPDRPVQLLLILGNNAGVTRFTVAPCCASRKTLVHAVTPAGSAERLGNADVRSVK